MKAWIAGFVAIWLIAAGGLLGFSWWGLSPIERNLVRAELEGELAMAVPNPPLLGRPLLHFSITATWLGSDRQVRWYTLPADVVRRALRRFFPTPLFVLITRIAIISALQALLAAVVLWTAIRGACGGSGGTPVPPTGRAPGGGR